MPLLTAPAPTSFRATRGRRRPWRRRERLGDQRRLPHRQEIVDQLQLVAGAGRADMEDVLGEGLQRRLDRRETSAASAPTMTLSRPSSASLGVRASGASTKVTPFFARSAAIRAVESGSLVEQSTTIRPAARALEQAVLPVDDLFHLRRAGDAEEDDVALRAPARRRSSLRVAPSLTRLSTGARLRWPRTVSGKPLVDEVLGHAVAHQADADEADALRGAHAFLLHEIFILFLLQNRIVILQCTVKRFSKTAPAEPERTKQRMRAPRTFDDLAIAISRRYAELPGRLRQIAEFALQHPNEMALGTVAAIAERAGVQPSSIMRFANSFGFDGFSDMQTVFRTRLCRGSAELSRAHRGAAHRAAAERQRPQRQPVGRARRSSSRDGIAALEHLHESGRAPARSTSARARAGQARSDIYIAGAGPLVPGRVLPALRAQPPRPALASVDGIGGMARDQARADRPQRRR